MFILPMGLIIKYGACDTFWAGEAITAAGVDVDSFAAITVGAVLWDNLVPVILGNIVGGAVFVGAYFWAAYRRDDIKAQEQAPRAEESQNPPAEPRCDRRTPHTDRGASEFRVYSGAAISAP